MTQKQFALDPRVKAAMWKGAEYARYLGSSAMHTEHLLLGFLQVGDDLFRHTSNRTIREKILATVPRSTPIDPRQELPCSDGVVRALGPLNVGDAEAQAHTLGPEHVLLAILDEPGVAADVLRSFGIASRADLNVREERS
jgi:ATP-dependent Clp protease ATP-binding subunit ClpA